MHIAVIAPISIKNPSAICAGNIINRICSFGISLDSIPAPISIIMLPIINGNAISMPTTHEFLNTVSMISSVIVVPKRVEIGNLS